MLQAITGVLDRWATKRMTRHGQRPVLLAPGDNALLIRNGALLPIFATTTDDGDRHANVGALWLAALVKVGNDETGQLSLEHSVISHLVAVGADPAIVQAHQDVFLQGRLRAQAAQTADETDGASAS